ncbi:MAG: Nudix family hydrolase [Hydrogenophilus sp.]|nr:Nudix family hydrolase [Hydrogenophilus sp.]
MHEVVVAAGVVWDRERRVLLGARGAEGPFAGFWEFPGGKVEVGESPQAAVARELREELGIEVTEGAITPWVVRTHEYPHGTVRLFFFQVWEWRGEPQARVHRALAWVRPEEGGVAPLLPANAPVLAALTWPEYMVISDAAAGLESGREQGWSEALARWERRVALAAAEGRVVAQVREPPALGVKRLRELVHHARAAGAVRVVVNGEMRWATEAGADGAHWSAARARGYWERRERGEDPRERGRLWLGVSVHHEGERAVALAVGADYWVVGPVQPTLSHPGANALGWEGFAALVGEAPVPVYAIGGLRGEDLSRVRAAGGHGVAAIRGWEEKGDLTLRGERAKRRGQDEREAERDRGVPDRSRR